MDIFAGPTPHKPLSPSDPSEIRLVRLYPAIFEKQPRCELVHYSLTEEENQPYIALSYTWGDPNGTKPISLNETSYPATTSLYSFLSYTQAILLTILEAVPPTLRQEYQQVSLQMLVCDILEDREFPRGFSPSSVGDIKKLVEAKLRAQLEYCLPEQPEKVDEHMEQLYRATDDPSDSHKSYLVLWIDAVCINQRDLAERSQQVRRMKDIYSHTMKLLVWLHPSDHDPKMGRAFDWMADRVDDLAICHLALKSPPEDPELREAVERTLLSEAFQGQALVSLGAITQHPWFTRAWIIQEISCASERASILVGYTPFFWADLTNLWDFCHVVSEGYSGMQRRLLDLRARNLGILQEVTDFYRAVTERPRELFDGLLNPLAQTLSMLLHQTAGAFKSTDARDVLYALLGLLGTDDLPAELAPDYTLSVLQVFQRYTIYLATKGGFIEFLDTCGKQMPGGPSWVPDWTCFRRGAVDGLAPARVPPDTVEVSADGNRLILWGVQLGKVVDVISPDSDVVNMADRGYEANDMPDNIRFSYVARAYIMLKENCKNQWAKVMTGLSSDDFDGHWIRFWAPISKERLDLDVVEFIEGNSDAWDETYGEGELQCRLCQVSEEIKRICNGRMAILDPEPWLPSGGLADILQTEKCIEKGHILCMLQGLRMPCMLCPTRGGDGFRFVSTCGHTSFSLNDPDETFYSDNIVERFTLV
ncbi:hypothetical protein FOVG_16209 [Fusarium oxysporum f. sp. pisi HDV247]|uniref:Heterokaryon incompatibility domain-containing protein n=1 Tax=Fusarium oxysporum f. sp. pisi HDV247 TaxID=1080344 RepID=W9NXQ1_FUSOX|nr:hypothetical protein FOVG_16209 [Fusarium oxysporum f. sp. pisi HDV247]